MVTQQTLYQVNQSYDTSLINGKSRFFFVLDSPASKKEKSSRKIQWSSFMVLLTAICVMSPTSSGSNTCLIPYIFDGEWTKKTGVTIHCTHKARNYRLSLSAMMRCGGRGDHILQCLGLLCGCPCPYWKTSMIPGRICSFVNAIGSFWNVSV